MRPAGEGQTIARTTDEFRHAYPTRPSNFGASLANASPCVMCWKWNDFYEYVQVYVCVVAGARFEKTVIWYTIWESFESKISNTYASSNYFIIKFFPSASVSCKWAFVLLVFSCRHGAIQFQTQNWARAHRTWHAEVIVRLMKCPLKPRCFGRYRRVFDGETDLCICIFIFTANTHEWMSVISAK